MTFDPDPRMWKPSPWQELRGIVRSVGGGFLQSVDVANVNFKLLEVSVYTDTPVSTSDMCTYVIEVFPLPLDLVGDHLLFFWVVNAPQQVLPGFLDVLDPGRA